MKKVRLVAGKPAEAAAKAGDIREAGYDVDHSLFSPEALRRLRQQPPDVFVIDLDRSPSQGRDVALAIRSYKDTRRVPIVFAGGDPAKVARVRELIPDAVFGGWEHLEAILRKAIANPPLHPVVHRSRLAGYAGAPLPKKLGIRPQTMVLLVEAPEGIERAIQPLPENAALTRDRSIRAGLVLWFVRTRQDLDNAVRGMARLPATGLWVLWPKKASEAASAITQNVVRAAGLAAGLVDYKVCSFDEIWAGLLFARRKAKPSS